MINKLNSIFVTFFGIGKIKKIPGTFASLATTLLLFFLFHILNVSPNIILFAVIIIFLISLYAINIFIKDLSNKDPKEVVIDEVIGQSIPLYLYEVSHNVPKDFNDALKFYLIIFILFRFFDIAKPFPVNYFDKNFKNSFGVIMDDVVAALYVVLILILFMIITT
jgi:phosphatidylglycerophosphatase A